MCLVGLMNKTDRMICINIIKDGVNLNYKVKYHQQDLDHWDVFMKICFIFLEVILGNMENILMIFFVLILLTINGIK